MYVKLVKEKFNNQPSTDVDELISTINNDMTPKYAEELKILNDTHEKTKNETQKQYLSLQMKRIELQSKNLNATVTTLNAISQLYKEFIQLNIRKLNNLIKK